MDPIENQEYILKIIRLAQSLDAYWHIDQSESNNGEVKISTFDEVFFKKRVYDYKSCYEEALEFFGVGGN